ncbi:MAG: DUF928 domain-containing protein [Crocosphaera sp.]|nr:DUF928 domain-containing protein [Crocosphaera sp.]
MLNNYKLLNLITLSLLLLNPSVILTEPINNPSTTNDRTLIRVLFKPPPDDKKPDQTRGAGSRHDGQCSIDTPSENRANTSSHQPDIIPLIPSSNFGLTTAERPIFWINLPETSAQQVVLSIKTEGKTHHSQTLISITEKSGLIALQPSPDSPPLEVGKVYQWAAVLVCGERPSPNDPAISAWVHRVPLSKPRNISTPLEQAAWYGEQGIWYDALTSLVQVKRSQPNNENLINIWAEFLESAGLQATSFQ